jgi:ankyrin repeat protein
MFSIESERINAMSKTFLKLAVGTFLIVGCGSTQFSSAAPSSSLRWSNHPAAAPKGRKIDFALLQASDKGNTAQVKKLLTQGANINATEADNLGRTALMFAAWKGHTATFKLLMAKGANWKIRDKGERSAFDYSVVAQSSDITDILSAKGAK